MGLDGITRDMLAWANITPILANYLIHVCKPGSNPGLWWQNKAIFIPKPGKELSLACNWQQIIISMLEHIYSGLLERRLRRITCLASRKTSFTVVSDVIPI
jgi:hypothetical protein